ncbi:mandelate racemase (plasmid) [Halorarum halophilum]|uniref:Mandelate racemase n=1 Tax=Halorarum halophilum TaxID=2743090 RepID=A0A7D5GKM8_9EURY|nr:enolase C-terminal domain-like protein [Halobaculum halophilum]QLG29911.1 mandelate racemase [Halobaculum halophilum]
MTPSITAIECVKFSYPIENMRSIGSSGGAVYDPGHVTERPVFAIRIESDLGVTGEYIASNTPPDHLLAQVGMVAGDLLGENPLRIERIWGTLNQSLRKYDKMGHGPIDIALWDLAGKYRDAPVHELLGSYRTRLPTYASTHHGDTNGGLDSPEAYADFAEECLDMGYPAFKIHGWSGDDVDIDREIETVLTVDKRVGDEMDLMLDPGCSYRTFADAIKVGRACDKAEFFWYEDPYSDGGLSQHSHHKLRELIDTPLLQCEHVRGLQIHTDFIANGATDFVRADPEYDGGITGAMKIARIAEGFGLDVEYHAPCPARRHCMAATRNTNYYEMALVHPDTPCTRHVPAYKGDYADLLDSIDNDGTVPVPDGPGLGVEIDWSYVESNEVDRWVYR